MTDDDYDALSQKQLASIKRDMRISLEDAAVRATYKVMAELETEQNQGEEHMTHELIAKLTEMLEIQTKLTETAVDMLKPAVDAAYQKGYADAMGWKTQNHLEHLPQRTWVGLTDEEQQQAYEQWQNDGWGVFYNAIEAKLKEKNT